MTSVAPSPNRVRCATSSSREVVSRLLKDFERRGRVRLGRSEVTLLDTGA
jgi:hypothetical protein